MIKNDKMNFHIDVENLKPESMLDLTPNTARNSKRKYFESDYHLTKSYREKYDPKRPTTTTSEMRVKEQKDLARQEKMEKQA